MKQKTIGILYDELKPHSSLTRAPLDVFPSSSHRLLPLYLYGNSILREGEELPYEKGFTSLDLVVIQAHDDEPDKNVRRLLEYYKVPTYGSGSYAAGLSTSSKVLSNVAVRSGGMLVPHHIVTKSDMVQKTTWKHLGSRTFLDEVTTVADYYHPDEWVAALYEEELVQTFSRGYFTTNKYILEQPEGGAVAVTSHTVLHRGKLSVYIDELEDISYAEESVKLVSQWLHKLLHLGQFGNFYFWLLPDGRLSLRRVITTLPQLLQATDTHKQQLREAFNESIEEALLRR